MIWEQDFIWAAKKMKILPCRTYCECGVGPLEISHAKQFEGQCKKMILVEPNPQLASQAEIANLPVIKKAVGYEPGVATMVENGGSSYLRGSWSPSPDNFAQTFPVDVVTFDTLDDGEIDAMVLDCEGMEWAVLSKMRSRPALLGVEIWDNNPYKQKILDWLEENGYRVRFSSGPTGESKIYTLA